MKKIMRPRPGSSAIIAEKMFKWFFIFFFLFKTTMIHSQVYEWARNIGSTGTDEGFSIMLDAGGNVYTTGIFVGTADFDPGAGTYNLTSAGDRDIFISKMDAEGNFVWAKKMGGEGYDFGYSIAMDASGNIYISGQFTRTADFDPGPGIYNLSPANEGGADIYIVKLDTNGNFLWAKNMGSTGDDVAYAMTVDAGGNVYMTGLFMAIVDFDPGPGTYNLDSNNGSAFICKFDTNGNFVWARNIGGLVANGYAITVDASGNVYTTGQFAFTGDFDPGPGTFNLTSAGNMDVFISKLNSSGNFVWARNMGGPWDEYVSSILLDASGNIYTSGQFPDIADFDPGSGTYNLTSTGSFDIFLSKLDSNGNFIWAKNMGGSGDDRASSIAMDADKNLYITGFFMGTVDFDPGAGTYNLTSAGSDDIFISKFDSNGNFVWAKNMGGSDRDRSSSIVLNATGKIYLTGFFSATADFNPPKSASLTSKGSWDIFICKYNNIEAGIIENSFGRNFAIFPNPTRDYLKIELGEQLPSVEVAITNILGKEITRKRYTDVSELEVEITGAAGVYFLTVRSGNRTATIRIVKI